MARQLKTQIRFVSLSVYRVASSTNNLSAHSIQTTLQILLETCSILTIFLRTRIFVAPSASSLWDWYSGTLAGSLLTGLDTDMLSEASDLIQDHLAHLANILYDFEVEVEGCWAAGLVGGIVPDVEIWVLESFLDGDTR